MQFTLTADDMKEIKDMRQQSVVCRYFDNIQTRKFTVGDILLLKTKDYDDKWHYETINGKTGMAKRYVYVYEDDHGVGFVKSLKTSDGKLGKETICVADLREDQRFEVDPEYLDLVLMGDGKFNIKDLHKRATEKKKRVEEINGKSRLMTVTLSEINLFFSTMKPGDKFFTCGDLLGDYVNEYEVVKVTKRYVSSLSEDQRYDFDNHDHLIKDEKFVFKLDLKDEYGDDEERLSLDFCNEGLFSQKPITLQDQI